MNLSKLNADGSFTRVQTLPTGELLYGGAFDPPHLGHDCVLRALLALPGPTSLRLIPTLNPRLKTRAATGWEKRAVWIDAWVRDLKKHHSERRIDVTAMPGPTIQTLRQLQAQLAERPFIQAVGTDQLPLLPQWVEYPAFLGLSHWLWIRRHGHEPEWPRSLASNFPLSEHYFLDLKTPDISSTQVWDLLKNLDRRALALLPEVIRPYFESMLID